MIDNYKSLPIGDYQDILALCKDESLEELDRQVKILSILTKMDEDTLLNHLGIQGADIKDGIP